MLRDQRDNMSIQGDHRFHYLVSAFVLVIARISLSIGGFVVVVILASKYGATTTTDAYFIARMVPVTLIHPLGMAFNLAFVPVYMSVKENGERNDQSALASSFLRLTFFCSLVLTLIYIIGADWIVLLLAPGFNEPAHESAVLMTRIMAPSIFLTTVHAVFDSVLNARRRFVFSALSTLWVPAGALVGVLIWSDWWGIAGLAWGVVAGIALQAIMLLPIIWKYFTINGWWFDFRDQSMKRVLSGLGLSLMVISIWQINTAVDRMIASLLGEGAVSALSLGIIFLGLVPLIVAFPIYKVMYPELVKLVRQQNSERLRTFFRGNFLIIAFLTIPVAIGLAVFADPFTNLMFHYGKFSAEAASQTTEVIIYLALGLPGSIGVILAVYYFLVTQRGKLLLAILLLTITANVILDLVLMWLLGLGGIALASTLISLIRTGILVLILEKILQGRILFRFGIPFFKILLASLVAGLVMYFSYHQLLQLMSDEKAFSQCIILLIAGCSGIVVYLLANIVFRNTQIFDLLKHLKKPAETNTQES